MLAKRALHRGASAGGLVIASAEPALRRRLVQAFAQDDSSRKVWDTPAGAGLASHVAELIPSVVLFDLGPRREDDAFGIVAAVSALARTIVLADTDDEALAIRALAAGASGFCWRGTEPPLVRKAVQLVEAGEIWVGRRVMLRLIEEVARLRAAARRTVPGDQALTPRERDIARLVADGASNKEIADRLSISIKTVKTHLTNTFKKHGFSSRLQLGLALGPGPRSQTKV